MTKVRQYFVLPALPIAAFLACTIFLQTKKTPWVDECYTYYGITHDNWGEFVDSICSGVNFSPPLYFFLNWIIQLVFHIPIEALRVESALWISLGTFLIFLRCAKIFGFLSAFLGCTLVLLQSNLLIEQALEARHYGMFFAASAWMLFLFPHNQQFNSNRHKTLYFLAHLALSFTHYLGIVFSALTGIIRFWSQRKKGVTESLPIPEISSWVVALPVYLVLLAQQSSHLGNWAKPNNLSSLLEISFDSLSPLTLIIPILLFLLFIKSEKTPSSPNGLPPIVILAIIWFLTPLIFWIISHASTFNLFKDRYFIPKEAAVIVLISYFFHRIIPMFGTSKSSLSSRVLPLGGTFLVCISLLLLSSKRTLFGFDPSRDYHHKLLSSEAICKIPLPKLYSGDHLFFPNHYSKVSNANIRLIVSSKRLKEVYRRFNSSITTQAAPEFDLQSYILIMDRELTSANHILPPGHANVTFDKITETNGLINAYKIEITETKPE
jgi:hypothetical protein